MSCPTFSIITRTKDRPLLLRRALNSIKNQTYNDYEVILVNDNGDEEVLKNLLKEFEEDFFIVYDSYNTISFALPLLRVINVNTHRHMEQASNEGLKRASGRYVCIHDDDDSWEPEFLMEVHNEFMMMPVIEKNCAFMSVLTQHNKVFEVINFKNETVREVVKVNNVPWLQCLQLGFLLAGNIFPPISLVFEREVLDHIGMYDESLPVLGDWDFMLRLAYFTQIKVLKKPLANYHIRVLPSDIYGNSINTDGWSNLHVEYEANVRHKYQYTKVLLPNFKKKDISSDIVNAKASKSYWHWNYIKEVESIINNKVNYEYNINTIKNKIFSNRIDKRNKPVVAIFGCGKLYQDLGSVLHREFNIIYEIDQKFEKNDYFSRIGVIPQNICGITKGIEAVIVCMEHPQDSIKYLKNVDIPVYCVTTPY